MGNQPDPNTTITIKPSDLGLGNAPQHVTGNTVGAALTTVYIIAGMVAVIVIVIAGIRYVTANGDSSHIQSAKNTILYAVVGLVVIIAAAAITQFVIQNITK